MDKALRSFFSDPRAVQFFSRYATYNGSSPYEVPATLNMIPWVEAMGAYGVREGIYAIPLTLEKLAIGLGVKFQYNTKVSSIIHKNKKIQAVGLGGKETLPADAVFSTADVHETYTLLNDQEAPWAKRYRKTQPSSSGYVFYWGMDQLFPELSLNNIFFSNDYEKEFRSIFHENQPSENPTVYVNIGSKVTPEDAPKNGESWFVLVNTPPDSGQDWEKLGEDLRSSILGLLEKRLGKDVGKHIRVDGSWNPKQIETLTSSRGEVSTVFHPIPPLLPLAATRTETLGACCA